MVLCNKDIQMHKTRDLKFKRLTEVSPDLLLWQMNDVRVTAHLPLKTEIWNHKSISDFVAKKETCWQRDGLGHQAIFDGNTYLGWGGFQKEGNEWDFGLVLSPTAFGCGLSLTQEFLKQARKDDRIPYVTFLLPPSRRKLSALRKLGAEDIGTVTYDGQEFRKFKIETK